MIEQVFYVCTQSYIENRQTGEGTNVTSANKVAMFYNNGTALIASYEPDKYIRYDFSRTKPHASGTTKVYKQGNIIVGVYNNFKDGIRVITKKWTTDYTDCKKKQVK